MGAGVTTNPLIAAPLIYMARKTSGFLANPKALDNVITVFNPNSTASQMKIAVLKLMDALISDSRNKIEKNELSLYREHLELMPLSEIKKGVEDTLKSSEEFLNMNQSPDTKIPDVEEPVQDNRNLPQNNRTSLETPGVNPALFNTATMNQGTAGQTGLTASEHAFLDEQEKVMRLRQRGIA